MTTITLQFSFHEMQEEAQTPGMQIRRRPIIHSFTTQPSLFPTSIGILNSFTASSTVQADHQIGLAEDTRA